MNIAIIGTGNVGGALAEAWAKAGHAITLGVRDVGAFKGRQLLPTPGISVASIPEAAQQAGAILLAVPPGAAISVIQAMGDLRAKVVIDATNAIRESPEGYPTLYHAVRGLAPNAEAVKCFNTTGFENLRDPRYPSGPLDMFMAGDSPKAKDVAAQLARDAGFGSCIDFGGDAQVQQLEQFAMAWINLAITRGEGRNIGFRLVRR